MVEMRTRLAKRRVGSISASLMDDTIVNVALAAEAEAATHSAAMAQLWPYFAEPLFMPMMLVCKAWHAALSGFGLDTLWRAAFTLRFGHLLERWKDHLPPDVSYRQLYQAAVSAHGLLYIHSLGGLSQAPIEYVVLKYGAPADYMLRQRHINSAMRAILIDWLVSIVDDFRIVYRAVNLLDRYLASKIVRRSRLQLLGVACILIASKHEVLSEDKEGRNLPTPVELAYMTDDAYTAEQVVRMEGKVLRRLSFELPAATALDVFEHVLLTYAQPPWMKLEAPYNEALCRFLFDLTLQEYVFLEFGAEVCAVAALQLVLHAAGKVWPSSLQSELSARIGFTPPQMQRCVFALHTVWRASVTNPLQAVRQLHHSISLVDPPESPCVSMEGMEDVPCIAIPLRFEDSSLRALVDTTR